MKPSPIFKQALEECRKRLTAEPNFPPLQSIEKQLEYLVELDEGRSADVNRLQDINLGLLAVREFEPHDMQFARLLHEVSRRVEEIKFGR